MENSDNALTLAMTMRPMTPARGSLSWGDILPVLTRPGCGRSAWCLESLLTLGLDVPVGVEAATLSSSSCCGLQAVDLYHSDLHRAATVLARAPLAILKASACSLELKFSASHPWVIRMDSLLVGS